MLSVDDPLQPNFVLKIFWCDFFFNKWIVYLKEYVFFLPRIWIDLAYPIFEIIFQPLVLGLHPFI